MSHIFISYSHKDKKYVEKLEQKLIEEGFSVWIDHRIDYGSRWTAEIENAIDTCDAYIVVMSEDAKKSEWVQREVIHAERRKKPFFPLLLSGEFWFSLGNIQFVDVTNGLLPSEKFYERLSSVILRKKNVELVASKPVPEPAEHAFRKTLPVSQVQPTRKRKMLLVWIGGFVIMTSAIFGIVNLFQNNFAPTTPDEDALITETSYPVSTPEELVTSVARISDTWTRPADGMIMSYTPSGSFVMGSNDGDFDESPMHNVNMDAYWIDQTEVTNAMYAQCVSEGVCDSPQTTEHFKDSTYQDHPVVNVTWNDAQTYCSWAAVRLPTEAEWEKAARGTNGQTYPWGESSPTCALANYTGCIDDTTRVGIYPAGKSPYIVYDMAGNVWEWVADYYGETYYSISPQTNPTGPTSGSERVLRSGSWRIGSDRLTTSFRAGRIPNDVNNGIGFRCARSATP